MGKFKEQVWGESGERPHGMLAAGGTLAEIGQVLRHAQPGTTAIYAKTDVLALSPLARPWPGGS